MIIECLVKPCPWCKATPRLVCYCPQDVTWTWYIECMSNFCPMKPKSPYVSLRNTTKTNSKRINEKVDIMVERWNQGNPCEVIDKSILDLKDIQDNFTDIVFMDNQFNKPLCKDDLICRSDSVNKDLWNGKTIKGSRWRW